MNKEALTDLMMDHMMNPKNYGKLEDADGIGIGKNPENGEMVIIYLKTDGEAIGNVLFQAKGCMTTVIAGSILTQTVKKAGLEEAGEVARTMLEKVGGLPPNEAACSEMVAIALQAALEHVADRRRDPDAPPPTRMIQGTCSVEGATPHDA